MFAFPKLEEQKIQGVTVSQFSGLDTRWAAKTGSVREQKNMSSMALPCLSTRLGRKKLFTINQGEDIAAAYFLNKAYLITTMGETTKLYCGDDFEHLSLIFTSNIGEVPTSLMHYYKRKVCLFNLFDYEKGTTLVSASLTTMDQPLRTDAPDFTDVMTYAGRLMGCRVNQIRASAYNDLYDWDYDREMEDLTQRAYLKNFPTNSNFTACTAYKNHAVFFTEDEMYELRGDNPLEFELIKIADVGCLNRRTVCQIDGVLYFISRDGVYSYSSSMPTKISNQITDVPQGDDNGFEATLGGGGGGLYAWYMTEEGRRLFTYNVESKQWAQEDDIETVDIVGKFGKTYLVTRDSVYETDCEYKNADANNDGAKFAWEIVTAPIYSCTTALKRAARIAAFVEQKRAGELELYISFDDGEFEFVKSELFSGCRELCVSLGDRHYQKIVLKLKGKGEAKVHYISQSYVSGGKTQ